MDSCGSAALRLRWRTGTCRSSFCPHGLRLAVVARRWLFSRRFHLERYVHHRAALAGTVLGHRHTAVFAADRYSPACDALLEQAVRDGHPARADSAGESVSQSSLPVPCVQRYYGRESVNLRFSRSSGEMSTKRMWFFQQLPSLIVTVYCARNVTPEISTAHLLQRLNSVVGPSIRT